MQLTSISLSILAGAAAAFAAGQWEFVEVGSSGVIALEMMIVAPNLAIFFDRASNDPLMINNNTAWGALWNIKESTASPLALVTDTFCASGSFLSNGTMASVGGNVPAIAAAQDGRMSVRLFNPCADPNGTNCTVIDDPETLHLSTTRWYPSSARIFDGSIIIVGGMHEETPFYNTDPVNSYEFFPSKDNGVARPSEFLARSVPTNLFPRVFALPDGTLFLVANNQSIIYDIEKNIETPLPDIPNGVRVTNPFDGSATLLPLSPPDFTPEVLVCGGSNSSQLMPPTLLTSQDPASDQCSRITLTPEGIKKGWQVERLLEPRIMPELILLPNGQVLIINGGETGYAAIDSVGDPVGSSNADHPVFTPSLYTPNAPLGKRISNAGLPASNIERLYHSGVTLTPQANILIAGSNPNNQVVNNTVHPSQLTVEHLNPPFFSAPRPTINSAPSKIAFNSQFKLDISIPSNLKGNTIQVALMDLGFSSHAFHSSQRLVFMDAKLSADRKSLTVTSPPNNRVFPPGPGWIFLTIDESTSEAAQVMVGSGEAPPVKDQGIPLTFN